MPHYAYTEFGWYAGQIEAPVKRSTDLAPPTESTADTEGEPRAMWTGAAWATWPYAAPPPPSVWAAPAPAQVTMRQARLALLAAGKLAAVQAAIDAMSEPARSAAQIAWDYSSMVERHDGLVSALGPALALDEAQIDALFVQAAAL